MEKYWYSDGVEETKTGDNRMTSGYEIISDLNPWNLYHHYDDITGTMRFSRFPSPNNALDFVRRNDIKTYILMRDIDPLLDTT